MVTFLLNRKRLRSSENKSFGNDVYRVTYELDDLDTVPLFGAKYNFHLEGVVDCPEFLVYFPMLEKYEKLLVLLKYQIVQCTSKLSYVLKSFYLKLFQGWLKIMAWSYCIGNPLQNFSPKMLRRESTEVSLIECKA